MKCKKLCFSLVIAWALTGTITAFADGAMPNGAIILGSKAYSLSYANNSANQDEIQDAVTKSHGNIYVKNFSGNWIDNSTGNAVQLNLIPSVTYKDASGSHTISAGDGTASAPAPIQNDTAAVSFDDFVPNQYNGQPDKKGIATGLSLANIGDIKLTAGTSDIKIDGLKITRSGLSKDSDIKDIVISDGSTMLSPAVVFSDGIADINFTSPLVINAGQSKNLSILLNISPSAQIGAQFTLEFFDKSSIKTTSDISGDFPAASSLMTVVKANPGAMAVSLSGIPQSAAVNTSNVSLENITINSIDDVETLKSITFTQTGSAKDNDIANLKLYEGDKQVGTVQNVSHGKVTFKFNNEIEIGKTGPGQIILTLKGDILSGSGKNIKFEIANEYDIQAVGKTYGTTIIAPSQVLLPQNISTQIK